jgi:hypothetical protein
VELEILVNGKPINIEGLESDTRLSELLITVEESLKGSGATVVDILVDGDLVSPEDIEKLEEVKIVDHQKIELLCATAGEMVRIAIEDGPDGLEHLEELALNVSADLRVGKIKDAMDNYLQFIDGIEWFTTMLKNADRAFAAAMAESSLESERQNLIARLSEQTQAIQSAQEGEDWVGLADILEYEFPELFQDGSRLFKKILE